MGEEGGRGGWGQERVWIILWGNSENCILPFKLGSQVDRAEYVRDAGSFAAIHSFVMGENGRSKSMVFKLCIHLGEVQCTMSRALCVAMDCTKKARDHLQGFGLGSNPSQSDLMKSVPILPSLCQQKYTCSTTKDGQQQ